MNGPFLISERAKTVIWTSVHMTASASADPLQGPRFPRAFAGWQDRGRSRLWPVESHYQIDRAVGCGQPVGFLVRAGRVFLNVERKRAAGAGLHARQHRGVDEIAVDWVLDQKLRLAVIHCHGPEGIHRWELARLKRKDVIVLAAVEQLTVG